MHATRKRHVDWIALALFVSLVCIGWLMIFAAGYDQQSTVPFFNLSTQAGKQLLFIGIAAIIFIPVYIIDIKFWRTFSYLIYALTLIGLILVLVLGTTVKGATSWFTAGGFSLQPSEFAKFGTGLAIAGFLSSYRTDLRALRYQLGAIALLAGPAFLIFLQPDAGSALVFASFFLVLYRAGMPALLYIVGIAMIGLFISALLFPPFLVIAILVLMAAFISSLQLKDHLIWLPAFVILAITEIILWEYLIPLPVILINSLLLTITAIRRVRARFARHIVVLVPAVIVSIGLIFFVSYAFTNILEPHQQDRINVWLHPEQCDPQGSLYNVLQSKIAIGSGGLKGKGFLQGSMTNLNYVPEQTTDFIFSTIGEEQGFIGSASIIILYAFLLLRIIAMAERARSVFVRYYAYSVAGILFVHFFINIGMTMGMVPIIGIPLPFISYGGSSLIAFTIMMAVLFKMDKTRFES
ncbi:MAG: rod shape-determining protein RodA [Bacteroidetes bacterium]|nr:MAG: rod shape-determining protein RodA [Bacteroidota bacterium]